ncbi:MAG: calcium/sodium antiporter [Planctomycetota bacterium]
MLTTSSLGTTELLLAAATEPTLSLTVAILALVGGLFLLGFGADILVRGAITLALRLRLTPTVIGLTVLALGTSLPELVVSITAQLTDAKALAWGNVVGSNIFNIGLVLGVGALVRPLSISGSTVRLEYPFMLGAALLIALLIRSTDGTHILDRIEGGFLLVIFVLFTGFMIRLARKEVNARERERLHEAVTEAAGDTETEEPATSLRRAAVYALVGTAGLALGGSFLVSGAESLALHLDVPPRIVATVIVAALTGAPELVTTVAALLHRKGEMAVANVVGSNIFNTLMVLGAASTVRPLDIADAGLSTDLGFMIGVSALLGPLLLGKRLNRWEGSALLCVYVAYVVVLVGRVG